MSTSPPVDKRNTRDATYSTCVTSSSQTSAGDYPIPVSDEHSAKEHNAPIFQGGIPLCKATLAFEAPAIRHTMDKKYQRISRPVQMMQTAYDVVVIGSGYGGAIAASRMARAGKSVCLLELGRERWPSEFPVDSASAAPEIHVSGKVAPGSTLEQLDTGDPQGLYHLIIGEGQNAFVANGLGGTSLLNANVFLQADHRTLSQTCFPPEIRNDPKALDEYYELARQALQPEKYPDDFPRLPKLELFAEQAKLLGPDFEQRFSRVPQTTTFKDGYNNLGVYQKKSTLSGQDATGVNDSSKNSTLMNYLPDAWNHGAEIFCGCEARYIKPCKGGKNKWTVFFAWHGDKRGAFKDKIYTDLMWVQAKEFVFLGAGTLGTTELLLRSRAYGLNLSPKLGMNMSGNGDILAFGYNSNTVANAIGTQDPDYLEHHPVGPTINGIIDMRDEEVAPNVLDGYVIEEGAVPKALAPFLQTMFEKIPGKVEPKGQNIFDQVRKLASDASSKVLGPWHHGGSLNRSMVYLIMTHDDNQATMTLVDNAPYLQFVGVARSQHVEFLNNVLIKATNMVGAEYIPNPFTTKELGNAEITVHPLGGAGMSSGGTGMNGVTNHFGQVFKGMGSEVYDGLVVVDGSVVPAALGVNPFATISAFAERAVRGVALEKGYRIDYESKNGVIDFAHPMKCPRLPEDMEQAQKEIANSPKTGGARFTEVMEGYLHLGDEIEDYAIAIESAKGACSSARFYLSIDAWDINTLISKKNHAAMLTGTFSCGALSKDPFMVLRGEFQLFSQDPQTPDTDNLVYDFEMISTSGEIVHFHGYKVIDPSIALSASKTWRATTTLYITLTRPDKSVVGRGILTISAKNFSNELLSFEGIGASQWTKLVCAKRFLSYFTDQLASSFFAPFEPLEYPRFGPHKITYRTPPTETIAITASDGVETSMQKWIPNHGAKDMPILLVPGASVDYQIYALPTIPFNFVEYLLDHGYVVYCITIRVGKTPASKKNYTVYDARLDIAAATKYILKETKAPKIYAVVHCAGSVATACGLLDGTITGIGGLTASQVFMHPIYTGVTNFMAHIKPTPTSIYRKFYGPWYDIVYGDDHKFLDEMVRFYPVPSKEVCRSLVCHRTELVFGRLWDHANLNEATHNNLASFFGGVSMDNMELLRYMGVEGHVVDDRHNSLVTDENLKRLRDIPILFIHGGKNEVYTPEGTMKDYDLVREKLDSSLYERYVFENKGHLDPWMGKASFMDVYPRVEEHARRIILERGLKAGM